TWSSATSLESRCGDIERFDFDPATATFHFTYMTDDLTSVPYEGFEQRVVGTIAFNGIHFIREETEVER
ncbi:MAG TPA: hypothetical protein VHL57_00800, partial [Flavobacteriales bacterium]|nr:hypothetical protein [Flavobacteriales bacterium]